MGKISTDIVDRYQFAIYPAGVLVAVVFLLHALERLGKEKSIWGIAVCYLLLCFYGYGRGTVNYIYKGYEAARQSLCTEYKEVPGIYVTPGDHLVINDCLFLAQQEKTFPLTEEELEELPQVLEGMPQDELIVYVNIYYEEKQTAERIAEMLGYQRVTHLYDNTYTQIFVLSQAED